MYPVPKGRCRASILFSGPTPAVRDNRIFYAAINNERHNTKAMVEKQERCFIDI